MLRNLCLFLAAGASAITGCDVTVHESTKPDVHVTPPAQKSTEVHVSPKTPDVDVKVER